MSYLGAETNETDWAKRKRLKVWHQMLADTMLMNPSATDAELGETLKVGANTVATVRNTDLFKAYFDQRRKEFQEQVNGTAIERLNGKLAGLAEDAVDVLRERIEKERVTLGIDEVRETGEMALKALGFVPKTQLNKTTNVNNFVSVSRKDLDDSRKLLEGRVTSSVADGGLRGGPQLAIEAPMNVGEKDVSSSEAIAFEP